LKGEKQTLTNTKTAGQDLSFDERKMNRKRNPRSI
jgi:hypothetical protein